MELEDSNLGFVVVDRFHLAEFVVEEHFVVQKVELEVVLAIVVSMPMEFLVSTVLSEVHSES